MVERSFSREVALLGLGAGEEFRGEAIVAVAKALLESGVSYIGGYPGSPVSTLLDVCASAGDLLGELGVRYAASSNEAAAAAMLGASVQYPLRGAVTWKSTVGTNVAADALSSLASSGVTGGALVILGEDYGQGASALQERSLGFAMKSQMWLLDPRPNHPSVVRAVKKGFELSEASNTPVMLQLRIRLCHAYGKFTASDNRRPAVSRKEALRTADKDLLKITVPPVVFAQERDKRARRLPAAINFLAKENLNENFPGERSDVGIIVQGGQYNALNRALERLGLSDMYGNSKIPIYVLNVLYPLSEAEILEFFAGKERVLLVEEGQPDYLEQAISRILRNNGVPAQLSGKDVFPMSEFTADVVFRGVRRFFEGQGEASPRSEFVAAPEIPPRPPTFCTGCPERPIFSAMKMVEQELGPFHVGADIGCHGLAIFEPFNMGSTLLGYGLGVASVSALADGEGKRPITILGDGGFWHSGLTSGIVNAVQNQDDQVVVIIDNNSVAATGGQAIPSTRYRPNDETARLEIPDVLKALGVNWIRTVNSYRMAETITALREAMTTEERGLKVIIAEGECQLNRQRRERPALNRALEEGQRTVQQKFGVDEEVCTGDHSCIRLSGCPSLTVKPNPDPLRTDPVAHVDQSCVGCGVCGEIAHAAALCPSFHRIDVIVNPSLGDKLLDRIRFSYRNLLYRLASEEREMQA